MTGAGGRLKTSGHFSGLGRVDATIVFASGHQHGRIFGTVFYVVKGGVGVEGTELLRIFYRAEFGDVELAIGIEFDPQHVVNAHSGNDGADEVGPLGKLSAHKKAAVAAAFNGEFGWVGIMAINEMF